MQTPELYGLVLMGGRSQRMGKDKAQLVYHDKPQREYLYDLLNVHCQKAFLSVKVSDTSFPLPQIQDEYTMASPLNGILSALKNFPDQAWLTVPCDMPNVDEQLIKNLITMRHPDKIFTGFYDSDGHFPDPLLGIWEPHVLPLLEEYALHHKSPRNFLLNNDTHLLACPDSRYLQNINTPEEFKKFRSK
ncbi:MAG: NTP transferase domain-containing protein [Cyclobacteriaceae bacterium]|nr:NTP transferase domain-containing protein [Cyclobacteriaceae bacterium]